MQGYRLYSAGYIVQMIGRKRQFVDTTLSSPRLMTALMLRLGVAMIIAAALSLCSFKQAVHGAKKAGELILNIGWVGHPTKG